MTSLTTRTSGKTPSCPMVADLADIISGQGIVWLETPATFVESPNCDANDIPGAKCKHIITEGNVWGAAGGDSPVSQHLIFFPALN
mmetsp:Transcript_21837/g.45896  ORF Transcript_21837/g.45896 Transcript_21837/m.45896 type:complete len:86 (+) Transcript_21837:3706-3963(+)